MKKYLAIILALVLVASCFPMAAFADEPVTLVFKSLAWIADEQRAQREIIDEWNAEHPEIQVQLVSADWGSISQELLTAFETGDVPDIFHFAQPEIAEWKDLGFLEDLRPMLSEEDLADVNEDIWSGLMSKEGEIIGLPIQSEVDVIFYNKDIFDKYGITPPTMDDPWTLDECAEVARQLQNGEGGDFQGMGFPGLENAGRFFTEKFATKIGDPLVYQNDDGSLYMKLSDESVAVIEKLKGYIDEGIISKDMLSVEAGNIALAQFLNGKSGFIPSYGCWYRSQFINESEGMEGIDWGTAAPFAINDTSVYGYIQTISVPSAGKHKEEAFEFLKWYWNKENTLKVAQAAFIMPGRNSAANDPSLATAEYSWDTCQEAVKHNVLPDFVKLPGWGRVTAGIGTTILSEYFSGGITLEEAVSSWEKQATDILNEAAED